MRVVSLFTGAGGLDLGLKKAGHEIILQCEQDPGAQQVLRQNFPGTLLLPDVCSLETLPKGCELLVAGFPCIDISRAGLRKGFEGQSSGLVRHVFRLLQDAKDKQRPVPWVLLENVEALLDRGVNGMPHVKSLADSFEVIGYSSWAHRVICSAGFGVPNRRSRVFFLASLYGDARDVLLAQGPQFCLGSCLGATGDPSENGVCYECFQSCISPDDGREYSFALDLGNARSAPGVDVVPTFTTNNDRICLLLSTQKMGMLRIEDAERLQGFPEGFTWSCYPIQLPGLNAHKNKQIKDSEVDAWESKRYALLGNAVTVKVAEWLGERLSSPYTFKYIPSERDRALMPDFQNKHLPQKQGEFGMMEEGGLGLLVRSSRRSSEIDNSDEGDDIPMIDYGTQRNPSNSQKTSWPRAAWFVAGIGRFGVDEMSECPKKVPFEPLGKFISQVGKLPSQDVINTYIMRLREQGWNVENIVKKATKCGLNLIREVSEVVRMHGVPKDPDQIGPLVWCICRITKVWWPGYMLDPFDLPAQTSLPGAAVRSLSRAEKKAWLPVEYWEEENQDEGVKSEAELKKEDSLQKGQRKVVVTFFGDNSHDWVYAHNTLEFEKNRSEKEREARVLDEAGTLKRPKMFFKALEDANLWLAAKKSNRKNGRYSSAVASRAASLAAAENKKPRCGKCEACLNKMNGGNAFSKRCLYVRAQAAAAAGHVGAQVAIHGDKALGAKLEVYWPLDQKWFPGMVTGFDRLRLRHTVLYEDGDREIIALWSPCQLVRVLNQPKEWTAASEEQSRKEEEERNKRESQREPAAVETAPLTEFEANRQQMIQKNRKILSDMLDDESLAPVCPAAEEQDDETAFLTPQDILSAAQVVRQMLNASNDAAADTAKDDQSKHAQPSPEHNTNAAVTDLQELSITDANGGSGVKSARRDPSDDDVDGHAVHDVHVPKRAKMEEQSVVTEAVCLGKQ